MYKNVIWTTDGSEAADRALAHAKALVTESGGQLSVVYCVAVLAVPPEHDSGD